MVAPPFLTITALVAVFSWPGDAVGQTIPSLNYEVGDLAPFSSLCTPTGSGVVLSAFIEGGPDLSNTAFDEQVKSGGCDLFNYTLWAKVAAINYIGFFHQHHLWAVRFGERGFRIVYLESYESIDPSPNTDGRRPGRPVMQREA